LLKKEFSKCFNDSDEVILCPIYSAGEKNDGNYDSYKFGNLIIKNSKVNLIIVNHENDLLKYFKKNLFKDELIISMGAGTISTWIKNISQNEYFKKN